MSRVTCAKLYLDAAVQYAIFVKLISLYFFKLATHMHITPHGIAPTHHTATTGIQLFAAHLPAQSLDPADIAAAIALDYRIGHRISEPAAQALQGHLTDILSRFVDGGHLERGTDYANRINRSTRSYFLEQTQAHTLQALGELAAIAYTGLVSPDVTSERGNKSAVRAAESARAQARAIIDAALSGRIDISTLPDNREAERALATTHHKNHHANNTDRTIVVLYLRDADDGMSPLSSPASDSHEAVSLYHEGVHALDDIDGTPIVPRGTQDNWSDIQFNAEYRAWYMERQLTHGSHPNTPLTQLANDITQVLTQQDGGYPGIWEGYQYNLQPFRTRVDMIASALRAGSDITPDMATAILAAPSTDTAQTIIQVASPAGRAGG